MKILMVCLGNICRSPLAEAVLRKKVRDAGLNWFIDSAGTNGFHTGEAPHHFTQKVAKANHIDISN
ncbi:MAG: low molecular weight phosphotyrosine protein phosphatase, partial [Ferruginibacter sp.]